MTSTADTDTVPMLHVCSDHFAEHERLTVWHELLGSKVLGTEAKPLPDSRFHFDRRLYDLPNLLMLSGRGPGAQFHRSKSMLKSDALTLVIDECSPRLSFAVRAISCATSRATHATSTCSTPAGRSSAASSSRAVARAIGCGRYRPS